MVGHISSRNKSHHKTQNYLFDNWLQVFKKWIIEKVADADFQAIINLLDRYHTRIFAFGV